MTRDQGWSRKLCRRAPGTARAHRGRARTAGWSPRATSSATRSRTCPPGPPAPRPGPRPRWRRAAGELGGVIFHRVVQQGGAGDVGVVHAIVGHDPDRHPEQVVKVRFAFPAVGGVQLGGQVKDLTEALPIRAGKRRESPWRTAPAVPGSPYVEVIACSGIVATSRRSPVSMSSRNTTNSAHRRAGDEQLHIATVDAGRDRASTRPLVLDGDRIEAVGAGPLPERWSTRASSGIDGAGPAGHPGAGQHPSPPVPVDHPRVRGGRHAVRLADHAVPGLGPAGPPRLVHASAAANLGWLALTGCTTTTDHHYVFPAGARRPAGGRDPRRRQIGLRFHPARGSMDLGPVRRRAAAGHGGRGPRRRSWPPREAAIDRWHDPSPAR